MLLRVTRAIPHPPRRRLAGSATLRIPTQFANAIHEKTILLDCILSSCSRRPRACRHRLRQRPVHPPGAPRGTRTRVIGRAALDLLLGQPDTASPYFFPADWGEGHLIGVVRVLDRLCASAKLDDITPHTLRHTFASVAADLGFSERTIAAPLDPIDEALRLAADEVAREIPATLDQPEPAGCPLRSGHQAEPVGADRGS